MALVSTATDAATPTHQHVTVNRPNPVSVGTIVWLASELMFFAALFAMYFTVRQTMPAEEWALQADKLNIGFSTINTIEIGRASCRERVWDAEPDSAVQSAGGHN